MRGTITTRHLVRCAPTIIHEFGVGTYIKCIYTALSGGNTTFLDCAIRWGRPSAKSSSTTCRFKG